MTPTQVIALINQYVISNGVGSITGPILNNVLQAIVGLFTAPSPASRIVATSTTLAILAADYAIGMQRLINLAPFVANLPADAAIGQTFKLQDLTGTFAAYPATVTPPAGHTINTRANYVMNEDNQTAYFQFYGSGVWGVDPA